MMAVGSGDSKCPKCGGNTDSGRSGSITQWVVNCACASLPTSEIDNDQLKIEICTKCKKRVEAGRSGSLTQWIFRSDLCNCEAGGRVFFERKEGDFGKQIEANSNTTNGARSKSIEHTLVELEIDRDRFPVERYGPIRVLGSGGCGTVYLCNDRLLKKNVAIKILTQMSADQLIAFQGEARAASRFSHPSVVKVLDFGVTVGGVPYMVMEFVQGNNLAKILEQEGTLNIAAALYIFTRVCDGLAEAHKQGVFHRDIKSSNILVGPLDSLAPDVRLIDFGVASYNPTSCSTTSQGITLVGTPAYMSPDQALGRPYDARCEVYSMGCTLFEALTGKPPFSDGATALEIMNRHAHSSPPSLSEAQPGVQYPDKLEKIVARCLDKNPDQRYQTISDLKSDLNSIAFDKVMETGAASSASKPSEINWRTIVFVTTLIVCGALAFLSMFAFHASVHDEHATINQIASLAQKKVKPAKPIGEPQSDGLPPGFTRRNHREGGRDLPDVWFANPSMKNEGLKELIGTPITRLSLFENKNITRDGIEVISSLPLTYLQLTKTEIDDSSTPIIARIKTLNWLRVDGTQITNRGLKGLQPLKELRMLDLGACGGITDEGVEFVTAAFPNLIGLDIGDTSVTPKGILIVKKLKKLARLRLSERVSDKELKELVGMPLRALDLTSCAALTDQSLDSIAEMKELRWVELTGCVLITEGAVRKLEKERPDLNVICNFLGTSVDEFYMGPSDL